MVRTATRPRPTAMLVPVAAGLCLSGALASAVLAGFAGSAGAAMAFVLPGGSAFAIDPLRASVLAPLLLAGAASGLAGVRPGWDWFALVATAAVSILAADPFTAIFWFLIAASIALLRRDGAAGLAAVPAAWLMLVLHQAPSLGDQSWCDPLFQAAGGALLLAGGAWAALAADGLGLARAIAIGFTGMALVALGLGSDAAAVAAVAANALVAPLPALLAASLIEATGAAAFDWLGGIARGMARFAVLALVGLVFAAPLPPGPGFIAFAATWRVVVASSSWPLAMAMAVWFAAMGFAVLRAIGALCLGRPRSLRAAAADDARRPVLFGLALLIAGGVIAAAIHPASLAVAVPMAVIALVAARFLRRSLPIDVAAYDDGFARPPAWLPFGDPATQITASGFAAILRLPARAALARAALARLRSIAPRRRRR